jgi:hypothetical protein
MKIITIFLTITLVSGLVGCATRQEPLNTPMKPLRIKITGYPLNQQAERYGVVTTNFIDRFQGRADFSINLGEKVLQGQALTVDGSYSSFGSVFAQVYGSRGGSGYASADAFSRVAPGSSRGVAAAYGSGLRLDCEYIVNNNNAASTGVCRTSDGANFRFFGEVIGVVQ